MKKFEKINSKVTPLPLKDVDTDMIIPASYLRRVSREGYGDGLFRRFRDKDPDFPMNRSEFEGAEILASDYNFGCGSSREHAVWALLDYGFKVVIAKSFADIFFNNSGKNGLLLVTLPESEVDSILLDSQTGSLELSVDLEDLSVEWPDGKRLSFEYDPFRRHCLLEGLDDIDYIKRYENDIDDYFRKNGNNLFYSTLEPNR